MSAWHGIPPVYVPKKDLQGSRRERFTKVPLFSRWPVMESGETEAMGAGTPSCVSG